MKLSQNALEHLSLIGILGQIRFIPRYRLKVIMAQSLTESGFFKGGPTTYYTRSNNTNAFGMGYNQRGYATGYFRTGTGEKWAIYPIFGQAVLDRFAWDNTRPKNKPNPSESTDQDDYINRLRLCGYWVENGRDRGYTAIIESLLKKYDSDFNFCLNTPLIFMVSAFLFLK